MNSLLHITHANTVNTQRRSLRIGRKARRAS